MRKQGWMAIAAAAALGIPLLNCTDGPTTASARVSAKPELIVQQVNIAADFRSFIRPATPDGGSNSAEECDRIAQVKGWLSGSGLDLGVVAFHQTGGSPGINTGCGCPSQPWGGAPAGYTCKLSSAQCDSSGRSCAYSCKQKTPQATIS